MTRYDHPLPPNAPRDPQDAGLGGAPADGTPAHHRDRLATGAPSPSTPPPTPRPPTPACRPRCRPTPCRPRSTTGWSGLRSWSAIRCTPPESSPSPAGRRRQGQRSGSGAHQRAGLQHRYRRAHLVRADDERRRSRTSPPPRRDRDLYRRRSSPRSTASTRNRIAAFNPATGATHRRLCPERQLHRQRRHRQRRHRLHRRWLHQRQRPTRVDVAAVDRINGPYGRSTPT